MGLQFGFGLHQCASIPLRFASVSVASMFVSILQLLNDLLHVFGIKCLKCFRFDISRFAQLQHGS